MLAEFFFCVFMDRDEVEVHKQANKERGQYPAILTEQAWSIKDLLYDFFSSTEEEASCMHNQWRTLNHFIGLKV